MKIMCENCGEVVEDLGYRYQVCPECGNFLHIEKETDDD